MVTRSGAAWVVWGALVAGCSVPDPVTTDDSILTSEPVQALACDAPVDVRAAGGQSAHMSVHDHLVEATRSVSGGAVVAVGPPGAVRYCAAGHADSAGAQLASDDVFRIASITKTFTAVLLLQLVDEGHLRLDEQVTDILPELTLAEGISVRQLLNHSSGLPDFMDASFDLAVKEDWDRSWTATELLEPVSRKERLFEPPGTQHRYSNTNFLVAGLLVEQITGQPLRDSLRTRITDPLGMTQTGFSSGGPEPVTGFSPVLPRGNSESVSYRALDTSAGAAGGMVSTAPDLVKFATALAEGKLISPETFAEMTDFSPVDDGMAVGLGIMEDEAGRIHHEGRLPGYGSLLIFPVASGEVAVVLSNDTYVNVLTLANNILPEP